MGVRSWIVWRGKDIGYGLLGRILWARPTAAAIVVENSRLLAIDVGDYLMLPGGGLKKGESFKEASERETLEETGYRVQVEQELSEGINSVGGVEKIFQAELSSEKPVHGGTWEGEPVWIDLEDVDNQRWRHDRNVKSLLGDEQS